jgi:membrane protein YdbS with pleckstrin-like domain
MKFYSKIGWWFHLTVLAVMATTVWMFTLYFQERIVSLLVSSILFLAVDIFLILPIYFATYYTLEETALHIRSGLVISKRLPYGDIVMIYETKDPAASAGLSLDRISVNTSKGEILISPKNKQEFMRLLNQRMEQAKGG